MFAAVYLGEDCYYLLGSIKDERKEKEVSLKASQGFVTTVF